jgi:alkylation response protein AidB-like acyl-CoA dehydrogenase
MNFELNENQKMIAQMVRDFAEKEIRPNMMKWDQDEIFPVEAMKKIGELGLLGIYIPEEYGGSGFGYFEYATALMELGKVCGGVGLSVAAHNSLCTGHIYYHGTEEQKKKYLPLLASGEWIGAWGLTEPNTGSDAMRMKTTAVKEGNEWVINGAKNWITHGLSGDVAVVLVRTGELLDSNGITAFIIEKGTPGFSAVKIKDKFGHYFEGHVVLILNPFSDERIYYCSMYPGALDNCEYVHVVDLNCSEIDNFGKVETLQVLNKYNEDELEPSYTEEEIRMLKLKELENVKN